MIRGVIKKIGEIFLRDKGKKYIIVEGDKNLINPDYEISVDDLGGGSNNGGGGSSDGCKDEYSTDYPDDFIIMYANGTALLAQISLKEIKGKVESSVTRRPIGELYMRIPNLIDESVQLIYDFPEATYKGSPFDPTKYYVKPTVRVPDGVEPKSIALSVKQINGHPVCIGNAYGGDDYIPLTIKFKTKDNKSYKFTTRILTSEYNSINPLNLSSNANYIHCEVKYSDLESQS